MIFTVVVFILVLGLLVFFHEMGHFIAAKLCNVYVTRFSLGMPPRIFGIQIGETDYCIGAAPIGGFVSMAGQEDVPKTDEERSEMYGEVPPERWFNNRPKWQRAIIFAAGPFMNIVLAVILYGIVAGFGENVPYMKITNRVGLVEENAPAATAPLYRLPSDGGEVNLDAPPEAVGWKTGDAILAINGHDVRSIQEDVVYDAVMGAGEVQRVKISRSFPDGSSEHYLSLAEPRLLDEDARHARFGITPFQPALVGEVLPGTPAAEAGLKPGDQIVRLNGDPIDATTFTEIVSDLEGPASLNLALERGEETINVELQPQIIPHIDGVIFGSIEGDEFETLALHEGEEELQRQPVVGGVTRRGAEAGGEMPLRAGDRIAEINGQPATAGLLKETLEDSMGGTVELTVDRESVLLGLVRPGGTTTYEFEVKPRRAVGIVWDVKQVFNRAPLPQVLPEAVDRSYNALRRTVQFVGELVTGEMGPRNLGGPVMIMRATGQAARLGYSWLLELTAFISVNLAVINLLPLPVLDGGHLMLLAIEGVRGKPLSQRVAERIQQVGLALILTLIVFVIGNDIYTWITDLAR